jgi:flagellar hook-associated protein 3 FlgL
MRISTSQMQDRGISAILERQAEISRTQLQLATGRRVLTPSDDALASTQALALKQVIATYGQYQENSAVAEARLVREEGALTQSINVLQRVRELAIQVNNDSLDSVSRTNLAAEVRGILDDMVSIANMVDVNGEYLFAGFNVDTPPVIASEVPAGSGLFDYTYTGDLGQRSVQIGDIRQVAVGDSGQDVFMDVPVSGGGTQNIFETLEQFALDLESDAPNTAIIEDTLRAIDHLGDFRTRVAARQNAIDNHRNLNDNIVLQSNKTLSEVQDLDFAEAVSRMNLQLVSLQASQQSFSRIQNLSLFNFL